MEPQEIKDKLISTLDKLVENDTYLLKNDISEWAITHRLAVYLEGKFSGYSVDCEYNGYVGSDNNKKYILILKERAKELKISRDSDVEDEEFINRHVYPDIVIHKRGNNTDGANLLIIEVKKSTSKIDKSYDMEKLSRYTSSDYDNKLNYKLGAFIIVVIDKNNPSYSVDWYMNGNKIF